MFTYLLTYFGREGEKIELRSCVKVEVVVLGSPFLWTYSNTELEVEAPSLMHRKRFLCTLSTNQSVRERSR